MDIELDPEIAKRCEQIRSTWTPEIYNKRRQGPEPNKWVVPIILDDDIEAAEKEAAERWT